MPRGESGPKAWTTKGYQEFYSTQSGKLPTVEDRYAAIKEKLDQEIKNYLGANLDSKEVKAYFAARFVSALTICRDNPESGKELLNNLVEYYRSFFDENEHAFGSFNTFASGFRAEFTTAEAFLEAGHKIYGSTDKEDNESKIDWWVVPKYEQHAEGKVWGIQVKHFRGLKEPTVIIPTWENLEAVAKTVTPENADPDRVGKTRRQIKIMLDHCADYSNVVPVYVLVPDGYFETTTGMPTETFVNFIDLKVKELCGQEVEMVKNE